MQIKIKTRIKNKLLIVLILTALLPLIILGWVGYRSTLNIGHIASEANREIANLAMSDSSLALTTELKTRLVILTEHYAGDINQILKQVQADTIKLSNFASYLYNHSDTLKRYATPSIYEPAPEQGMFGSRKPNENSWLGVFGKGVNAQGKVTPATLKEIQLTEYMDILFKSIAATNQYAVQIYINTAGQLSRGMPFVNGQFHWVDATQQFAHLADVTAFDFYYLADAIHNPERGPKWTELYWDPAGLGWMVSSIAPVYRGNDLVAVVGIDLTLEKIVTRILNLHIEQNGFAFLMSERGQAIAFPQRAADFLEFRGNLQGKFKENQAFAHLLTQVRDPAFQTIIDNMRHRKHDLTIYLDPQNQKDYFFAYHPISVTGWSVGIIVPVAEVILPAMITNQKIEQSRTRTDAMLSERTSELVHTFLWLLIGIITALISSALIFARTISRPIQALAAGARLVGAGALEHRIDIHSGDEIEDLALTFNQMANDLQNKLNELEAANRELTQLDQLKSKFISMASHELRTPLIAIQGYVDLIREGRGGEIAKEQRLMLDTVSRNATRLARIVTELLDISRIEENQLILERVPLALPTIVNQIAEEQQPYLASRSHTLILDFPEDLPLIDGDPDRISQVIINLLGNAIKYTPDGGKITINAGLIDSKVQLTVSDNGIGIRPEDLGKLFKRFSTLGDITKHRSGKNEFLAGGTGLGLSIVQGIMQAHGGRVSVTSEYGKGSAFHLEFPLAAQQTLPAAPLTPRERPVESPVAEELTPAFKIRKFEQPQLTQIDTTMDSQLTVLIIDDEEDVIVFTRDLLQDNYAILSAQTSATALKTAITRKPNVILLDAWMPGISGYDLCRTLKRNANTRETPIIIFTAATQQIDEERARECGADGFVTKPFRRDQLVNLIDSFRDNTNEYSP